MAASLEGILSRLLEPENEVIQKATQDLHAVFKNKDTLQNLCHILGTSSKPQIRQYAAVLIRRKIYKLKQWAHVDENFKNNIRGNILQLLVREDGRGPRSAISQIIGVIARHDTPNNQWPALFDFVVSFLKDEDASKRETGMVVLSSVTAVASEQMKPHMVSLLNLLAESLEDRVNIEVAFLAVKSMTDLLFYIGDDELKHIQNVVPRVLEVIQILAVHDEDKACQALEFFDELLESEVAIIVPHLKPLLQYCLQTASNKDYTDALRVKAMSFVASLVRLKKKTVMKHHMVEPILQVLFPIICDDDEEEDDEDEAESHTPSQYAVQVIDTMALHLPPEKFLKKVTPMVETCLKSNEPSHRRAAYLVMAVVVEGCGDYVMNKMLPQMLQMVCQGLNDPSHLVRNASLFAVGQFSEHLQPDISKFASQLLPLLFQYLNKSMEEVDKNPKGVIKSHYALEMFCENLGAGILPFLPELMGYLLNVIHNCHLHKPKELAISAIGAAANAAKEEMRPYFKDILELFKVFLTVSSEDKEEDKKLQLAAIDTLAVFARCIGGETFRPLATECINLGLNLLNSSSDPDLRRCVYSLFAAISTVMKSEMVDYLETIVNFIFTSMKSTEGVKAHYKHEGECVTVFDEDDFSDGEDLETEDGDEEEDYKLEGISVENAYLDEKEDACCALGELAFNTGPAFFPLLQKSYAEVVDLVSYPAVGIKKAAFSTLCQLCLCVDEAHKATQSAETYEALKTMILGVVPRYLEAIKTEMDRTLVMSAVDSLQEMLDKMGQIVLSITGATDAILTAMKEIFTHKVACQDQDDETEDEAEFDSMLIESAGDVLPVMARIMGGENFLPFFTSFVQDLLKRLKETSSTAEKSFAVGTLAEVIEACGSAVGSVFTNTLYPVFTRMTTDEDEEVRSNSVFALGVLAVNGGDFMVSHYSEVLKTLFSVMSTETNPRVMDNVCAAVCRMIWHSPQNVPLAQVLPVVVQLLPLKEDFEENVTVFTCLMKLYSESVPELVPLIPKLLTVVAAVVKTENIKDDTRIMMIEFVKNVKEKFPSEFGQVYSHLEPELVAVLDTCINSNTSS